MDGGKDIMSVIRTNGGKDTLCLSLIYHLRIIWAQFENISGPLVYVRKNRSSTESY